MKKVFLAALLSVSLILGACGSPFSGKSEGLPNVEQVEMSQAEDYGIAEDSMANGSGEIGELGDDISGEDADAVSNVESPAEADGSGQSEDKNDGQKKQKLVYTCDMTIETLEYEQTVKSIKEQIKKYKGIIEEESQTDSNYNWYNTSYKSSASLRSFMVIRIPAEHYQEFLEELDGKGKITNKDMRVENITKHYTEVSTTINSLKTQEKRLLAMMEKAETIEDMITVEKRLTEVQNQLAQYKNVLSALDTDVSYSTINLNIEEVVKYEAKQDTFSERLQMTIQDSADTFLSFLEGSLFTIIMVGPIAIVCIFVLWIILRITRRWRQNRKMKKSKKAILHKGKKEERVTPVYEEKKDVADNNSPDEE